MNLDDIASGSLCVIDTNVLLYAEHGASPQAQRLLRRCGSGEIIGILPQPVWQELAHKLMLAEALMLEKISGTNQARKLARQPEVVKGLRIYRDKIQALAALGLGFEPCQKDDFMKYAFRYQEKYGLLTNDSVVLAVAVRLKADHLVTADEAFRKITEVSVIMPTDVNL
jgi:predicted nucleic acid-binding protein